MTVVIAVVGLIAVAFLLGKQDHNAASPAGHSGALVSPSQSPTFRGWTTVLSDDFSDPTSGWKTVRLPVGTGGYSDGAYVIDIPKGPAFIGAINSTSAMSDLYSSRTEVTITGLDKPGNFAGVFCHGNADGAYYDALIGSDGGYAIEKRLGKQISSLSSGSASDLVKPGAPVRLGVECYGGYGGVPYVVRLSIGGKAVATAQDTQADISNAGVLTIVAGSASKNGAGVTLDDVLVSKPTFASSSPPA